MVSNVVMEVDVLVVMGIVFVFVDSCFVFVLCWFVDDFYLLFDVVC